MACSVLLGAGADFNRSRPQDGKLTTLEDRPGPYPKCVKIFDGKTFDGKGTMRAAVDGVEIVRYRHKHAAERADPEKRIVAGPIGMFRHGGGASEYKEIYLEAEPQEDRLITVR